MDAYNGLIALIRTGEFDVGARLSESALAERLGVSRTPVREALRVLDAQRLVVSQGRGVKLRVPTQRELSEAFGMRAALEGYAAQEAARRQRDGLVLPVRIRELKQLAARCDAATRHDGPLAGANTNRQFHLALAALADNSQLDAHLTAIWDQLLIATRAGLDTSPRVEAVHSEHQQILRALTAGLPDEARAATEAHISRTSDIVDAQASHPKGRP